MALLELKTTKMCSLMISEMEDSDFQTVNCGKCSHWYQLILSPFHVTTLISNIYNFFVVFVKKRHIS